MAARAHLAGPYHATDAELRAQFLGMDSMYNNQTANGLWEEADARVAYDWMNSVSAGQAINDGNPGKS